jgi:hypothetical protein
VEKGAKGVDFSGDVNSPAVQQKQIEEKKDVGW